MASAVIFIFLLHLRSTMSVLITLPLSVGLCFILMYGFGVDANIMSLAGLAIAIGDVGDMGIIMTENIYRHIATGDKEKSHFDKVYRRRFGSRRRDRHRSLEHDRLIHPGLLSRRPGRKAVPAAGVHEDLRDRRIRHPRDHGSSLGVLFPVPPREVVEANGVDYRRCARRRFGPRRARGVHVGDVGGPLQRLADVHRGRGDRRAGVRAHDARAVPAAGSRTPSRAGIARVYIPTLRWILAHKKTFLVVPVIILFAGLTVWLGIGTMLAPAGWAINLFAREQASPELKQAMSLKRDRRRDPPAASSSTTCHGKRCAGPTVRPTVAFSGGGQTQRNAMLRWHAASKSCGREESCRASAASSCRRSTKARSSTCRRCCRKAGLGAGPRGRTPSRTWLSPACPKWNPSSANSAAPNPRSTLRPSA